MLIPTFLLRQHRQKHNLALPYCNGSITSGAGHSLTLQDGSRWITRSLATQNNFQRGDVDSRNMIYLGWRKMKVVDDEYKCTAKRFPINT